MWTKRVRCSLTTFLFCVQCWLAWRKLKTSWLEMPSGPLTSGMNSKKGRRCVERSQPEYCITFLATLNPSSHLQPQLLLPSFHLICYSTRQASKVKECIMHCGLRFKVSQLAVYWLITLRTKAYLLSMSHKGC